MPRFKILKNAPRNSGHTPGDVVDVPQMNAAIWAARPWAERVRGPKVEAAVEPPAPENAAERTLPPWTLKTRPEDYLEQYPDGPNAELARRHVEAR